MLDCTIIWNGGGKNDRYKLFFWNFVRLYFNLLNIK